MPLFDWIRSDLHSLNLDWIISKIKTVEESEQGAVDAAADANASKSAAAASATAANNSKTAAAGSATAAAGSAAQAQALVDQLDTTIAQDVSDWLDEHITPTTPAVDDTLTVSGAAADAAVTGDKITDLKTAIGNFPDLVDGYLDADGSIVSASTNAEKTTGYISVKPGMTVTFSETLDYDNPYSQWSVYGFYKDDKTWVERTTPVNVQQETMTNTVTIPSNVWFIRISFRTFNKLKSYKVDCNPTISERVQSLEQYNDFNLRQEIVPAAGSIGVCGCGVSFSGNTSQTDPLVVTIPAIYIRSKSSGYEYLSQSDSPFSLSHNEMLVYNIASKTITKENTTITMTKDKILLLWKQLTTIKGLWAFYYYDSAVLAETQKPKNGFNESNYLGTTVTLTDGYINADGTLLAQSSDKEKTTSYIPVKPGMVFTFTENIDYDQSYYQWSAYSYYSLDKTFLSRTTGYTVQNATMENTVTIPNGVWYIRISFRTFDKLLSYYFSATPSVGERVSVLEEKAQAQKVLLLPDRLMSRQGEGYGYPDNSIEAITAALNDGYRKIRVSVATTSDDVLYCSHVYEMENNSTLHVLKLDGDDYNSDVDIASVTSSFIDRLTYKGYAIPTLDDVLAVVAQYNAEVTLEIKNDVSTDYANNLINTVKYYAVHCILSGLITQISSIIAIDNSLDIGVIFHFTLSEYTSLLSTLNDQYNSLRIDCFYEDEFDKSDIIEIHDNAKIKLGGNTITPSQAKEYLSWVDCVEYQGQINALI